MIKDRQLKKMSILQGRILYNTDINNPKIMSHYSSQEKAFKYTFFDLINACA